MMLKWRKAVLAAGVSLLVLGVPLVVSASSGINDAASLLGKTADEIRQERLNGKSLTQIAEEQGASKEELLESFLTKRKEWLLDRVEQGLMTQEQADLCLSRMKERVSTNWERTETGKPDNVPGAGKGMGKGRGAMGHSGTGQGPGFGMGNANGMGQ